MAKDSGLRACRAQGGRLTRAGAAWRDRQRTRAPSVCRASTGSQRLSHTGGLGGTGEAQGEEPGLQEGPAIHSPTLFKLRLSTPL